MEKYKEQFGTIAVDECHHMPAQMFRKVIPQFNPYYLYGLTATPERKFNDAALIDLHIQETAVQLPFPIRTANLVLGSKALMFDTQRNQQVVADITLTGDFDIVVATGQLLSEGTDIPSFDALFFSLSVFFSSQIKAVYWSHSTWERYCPECL